MDIPTAIEAIAEAINRARYGRELPERELRYEDRSTQEYALRLARAAWQAAAPFITQGYYEECTKLRPALEAVSKDNQRLRSAGTFADGIEAAVQQAKMHKDYFAKTGKYCDLEAAISSLNFKPEVKP